MTLNPNGITETKKGIKQQLGTLFSYLFFA